MTTQFEFDFSPADRARGDDLERLVGLLRGRGWQTGQSLRIRLGWTDRRLRSVASGSDGKILSWPGSKGYCLTKEAAPNDIEHGCNALASQARDMLLRSEQIQRQAGLSGFARLVASNLDANYENGEPQHIEERE